MTEQTLYNYKNELNCQLSFDKSKLSVRSCKVWTLVNFTKNYVCTFRHNKVTRLQNCWTSREVFSKHVTSSSLMRHLIWHCAFICPSVQQWQIVFTCCRKLPTHSAWYNWKHVFSYRFAFSLPCTCLIASHLSFCCLSLRTLQKTYMQLLLMSPHHSQPVASLLSAPSYFGGELPARTESSCS